MVASSCNIISGCYAYQSVRELQKKADRLRKGSRCVTSIQPACQLGNLFLQNHIHCVKKAQKENLCGLNSAAEDC